MFIILEGVDRTGKTTLAQDLHEAYGVEYRHFSKPEQHPLDEYGRWLDTRWPPHVVVDRYHLGERIWPRIFGRPTQYDDAMHRWIELLLLSRGAFLVRTIRDLHEIKADAARDGEPIQGDQILVAAGLFAQEKAASLLPKTDVDIKRAPWHEGYAVAAQANARAAAFVAAVTPRWIGHMRPNVLLVGDEVGPTDRSWTLPFVPYRGTSGHFLMDELRLTTLKPAIVNSVSPSGEPEDIQGVLSLLGEPPVVALGRNAESRLRDLDILSESVPHPQWWRRFNRKAGPGSYGRSIQELVHG